MEEFSTLYKSIFGQEPDSIKPLSAAGSSRRYFRLSGLPSVVVGTYGDNQLENKAFVYLSNHFKTKDLPVPSVLAVSDDGKRYIQDDLGDKSLYDFIACNGAEDPDTFSLMVEALRGLADVQVKGADGIEWNRCFPRPAMDRRAIMWDLNYFKYCFLKSTGIEFDEEALENEMIHLCDVVEGDNLMGLMLRDFQSRNIMIHNSRPYIIDFQGARKGPLLYDVASFLWQARIALSHEQRLKLAEKYVAQMKSLGVDVGADWLQRLQTMALFRMIQVLGAYGFRGLQQQKAQFVTAIPTALNNALSLINSLPHCNLDYMKSLLTEVAALPQFKAEKNVGRLTVKVYSFSYKKGIPTDYSGNGGGFVFDCRALHNPGRYDEYKRLTGRDKPVIDFLETDGEILDFLKSCSEIVDRSVARYVKRGFTNLSVSFGCTGGQHRSVYSAEWMAHHIAEHFDCNVQLIHREQNITENLG